MIARGDIIICVSDEVNDFMESTTNITIGNSYECKSVWNSHNKIFASFYDDKNCYRNFMVEKFIKKGENFGKKRFEMLLKR